MCDAKRTEDVLHMRYIYNFKNIDADIRCMYNCTVQTFEFSALLESSLAIEPIQKSHSYDQNTVIVLRFLQKKAV